MAIVTANHEALMEDLARENPIRKEEPAIAYLERLLILGGVMPASEAVYKENYLPAASPLGYKPRR